jgi:FtsP/CotA-like multicopper oxidase with cupredoxin domain
VPQDLNPALNTYIHDYLDPANPHTPGAEIPIRDIRLERGNGAWQINGQFFDPNRVDVVEKLDGQSIWRLTNHSGGWQHPIHIHDMEFLILDRDGVAPHPAERGLKDTINVGENETVRVMACWTGPKNVGQYVFHCHNLEHEDMSMMGIIEVVL